MALKRTGRFAGRYIYAAAASLYLLTLGLASDRHRRWLYQLIAHFGYQPVRTLIPTVPLAEVLPGGTTVTIHEPLAAGGNVSLLELVVIASLIQQYQPDGLLEIGTLDGRTTLNMAANAGPSARVYTLDLPGQSSGARFRTQELSRRIVQLYGDSATFDFAKTCRALDFIFIDGDHRAEYVVSDSRRAVSLLRNGQGVIVWHDYDTWEWEGTTRALNQLYRQGAPYSGLRRVESTSLVYLLIDRGQRKV